MTTTKMIYALDIVLNYKGTPLLHVRHEFQGQLKTRAPLEHTWRTKEGGSTRLKNSDFRKNGKSQYTDVEIYCSLEEFVLTGKPWPWISVPYNY